MASMRSVRRRCGAALAAAALGAAGLAGGSPAAASAATPAWYYLGDINPGGVPVLAGDSAGDEYVAYALQDNAFPGYVIYVAERPAGAGTTLGTPVPVSATGTNDVSLYPSIAADAAGDVIVAWYDDGVIYAATKPANTTTFSAPVAVSDPNIAADPIIARQVSVAMDSAGDAIVVWPEYANGTDANNGDLLVGAMRPVGSSFAAASFGGPHDIYDPQNDDNQLVAPTAVVMGHGQAVIAYVASAVAYASIWAATSSTPGGATNLGGTTFCPGSSSSIYCSTPALTIDAHGDAVASFLSDDEIQNDPNVGVRTLLSVTESSGAWSGAATVTAGKFGSGPSSNIRLAASPNGHDVLAWDETTGLHNTDNEDEVAVGSVSGGLGTPVALDQPTSYLQSVGVDNHGAVLTTWTPGLSTPNNLESSVLPAGTTSWQPPQTLPDQIGSTAPTQHTRTNGNTVLAYPTPVNNGFGGDDLVLYGFDAAGATIHLTVPHTATTGHAVHTSVTVVDDYTTVSSPDISWNFGDGHVAAGFTPTHKYRNPGTYSVTVTVVDGAGIAATATKHIKVAPRTLTTSTPTISGTPRVGHTLTAHPGTWTAGTSFTYRWYAAGKPIPGATQNALTLNHHQRGKKIKVAVTGTKTGYRTVTTTSTAIGPVT